MSKLLAAHIALVEGVNNATTKAEHDAAYNRLNGFREALDCMSPKPNHIYLCDMHYLEQGIDRPMCGGIWLDWQPKEENT